MELDEGDAKRSEAWSVLCDVATSGLPAGHLRGLLLSLCIAPGAGAREMPEEVERDETPANQSCALGVIGSCVAPRICLRCTDTGELHQRMERWVSLLDEV
jgi:hypothetical protein